MPIWMLFTVELAQALTSTLVNIVVLCGVVWLYRRRGVLSRFRELATSASQPAASSLFPSLIASALSSAKTAASGSSASEGFGVQADLIDSLLLTTPPPVPQSSAPDSGAVDTNATTSASSTMTPSPTVEVNEDMMRTLIKEQLSKGVTPSSDIVAQTLNALMGGPRNRRRGGVKRPAL